MFIKIWLSCIKSNRLVCVSTSIGRLLERTHTLTHNNNISFSIFSNNNTAAAAALPPQATDFAAPDEKRLGSVTARRRHQSERSFRALAASPRDAHRRTSARRQMKARTHTERYFRRRDAAQEATAAATQKLHASLLSEPADARRVGSELQDCTLHRRTI